MFYFEKTAIGALACLFTCAGSSEARDAAMGGALRAAIAGAPLRESTCIQRRRHGKFTCQRSLEPGARRTPYYHPARDQGEST